MLWGIPLRLVLVYHVTWLVNSATHCWGEAVAYESGDKPHATTPGWRL